MSLYMYLYLYIRVVQVTDTAKLTLYILQIEKVMHGVELQTTLADE